MRRIASYIQVMAALPHGRVANKNKSSQLRNVELCYCLHVHIEWEEASRLVGVIAMSTIHRYFINMHFLGSNITFEYMVQRTYYYSYNRN